MPRQPDPRICIIGGCGHVGLPLGLSFADKGFQVDLLDIDTATIEKVNQGTMPFMENGAEDVLARNIGTRIQATADKSVVAKADAIIVTIGTPVDEYLNPEVGAFLDAIDGLVPSFRDGQLVVLRSTIFPGTTELVAERFKEQGLDIDLAFCPERVLQGRSLEEIAGLPQVVAAFTDTARRRASDLFLQLTAEVVEVPPLEAELVKLFANAWRYIQFAAANQFYMIAESYGADYDKVFHGLTHNYPRAQHFARPGLTAGPCLFKDTMQLSAFHGNKFFLGHAAMLVNEGLPAFLVERVRSQTDLMGKKVGILGMAFKPETEDTRGSLSYKLAKTLRAHGAKVLCTDPYVDDDTLVTLETVLEECDLLFMACPHDSYRELDLSAHNVVDVWQNRSVNIHEDPSDRKQRLHRWVSG